MSGLLKVSDLHVSYGDIPALRGIELETEEGDLRVILGANGAGKSTIIKAILGLVKIRRGSIEFAGETISGRPPHEINRLGISWVPEGRQLWSSLTVLDNLKMGGFAQRDSAVVTRRIEGMFERFPRLRERRDQLAGSLSGGEQQMLAIARALITRPRLILMDEPSLGLAPMLVRDVFDLVKEINEMSISVLMVEQNARMSLRIASWAYLLEVGRVVTSGPAATLAASKEVHEVFLSGRPEIGEKHGQTNEPREASSQPAPGPTEVA
jgi:branched-chain amino acid transport system ATP-binding protein